jgi:hypothetical protein
MAVRISWSSALGGSEVLLLLLLLPLGMLLAILSVPSAWAVGGGKLGGLTVAVVPWLDRDGVVAGADEPPMASFANSFAKSLREWLQKRMYRSKMTLKKFSCAL